jgi:hypothetical protein
MHKGDSKTGWTAYVEAFKAKHPTATIDYKILLQQYIRGIKI